MTLSLSNFSNIDRLTTRLLSNTFKKMHILRQIKCLNIILLTTAIVGTSELITVNLITDSVLKSVNGYARTYKNLMAFLSAKLELDDMGECKGMGRCGTCQIRIENDCSLIGDYDGNEINTLKMLGNIDPKVRLACKIYFNEQIDNMVISII